MRAHRLSRNTRYGRWRGRPGRRGALAPILLLAALAAVLFPARAGAHATLVRAQPADSAVLSEAPRHVRLSFSEGISPEFSSGRVLDGRGRELILKGSRVTGNGLVLELPTGLERGVYTIFWKVLSEDDVHVTQGSIVFGIGVGTVVRPAGAIETSVPPAEPVLKWLNFCLFAGLLGGLAVARLVLPTPATRRRALRLAVICSALALALGCGLLVLEVSTIGGGSGGEGSATSVLRRLLTDTRWGALWIGRETVLVALTGALVLLARAERDKLSPSFRRLTSPYAFVPVVVLGLALVFLQALASHAAGLARDGALAVTADALHLLTACLWIGGIAAMAVSLVGADSRVWRSALRPFGRLAAASAGIVVATGLYSAGREVASPAELAGTLYGKELLAKSALVLAVGLLGAVNAVLVHPELARPLARALRRPHGWVPLELRRLPLLVAAEASIGLTVFLAAGLLSSTPPARGGSAAEPGPAPTMRTQSVGDLLVSLTTKPNRPGVNAFSVRAASSRRPAPGPITGVWLRFAPADAEAMRAPVRLNEVQPGQYQLGGDYLRRSGPWRIEVVVARTGLPATFARFDWDVPGAMAPAFGLENGSLERPLALAAALLLALVLIALVWTSFGRSPIVIRDRVPFRALERGP